MIDERAPTLPVRRHVQGEYATSGFINELRGPSATEGSTVLRVRSAWNGGCCSPGELDDFYLRDGEVVAAISATMPPLVGDAVLRGKDPQTRTIVKRTVFCGDAVDARELDEARKAVQVLIEDVEHQQD